MPAQKFTAIALTYRPKSGITPTEISRLIRFLTEKSFDFHAVTETVGDDPSTKHLHACCFFSNPVALGDIFGKTKRFGNLMVPLLERSESLWRRAVTVKGVYNDDWISKYLLKDANHVTLNKCELSEEIRQTYYSDIEPRDGARSGPSDKYFSWLEELWYEFNEKLPSGIEECANFLSCMMYKDRRIAVIQDPRQMKQKSRCLFCYLQKSESYDWHSRVQLCDEDELWASGPRVNMVN